LLRFIIAETPMMYAHNYKYNIKCGGVCVCCVCVVCVCVCVRVCDREGEREREREREGERVSNALDWLQANGT